MNDVGKPLRTGLDRPGLQIEGLGSILGRLLERADVSPEVKESILGVFDEYKIVTGSVVIVDSADTIDYAVVQPPSGFAVRFDFPPNDEKFLAEFKRAQSNPDLRLHVFFHYEVPTRGRPNIIDSVWVLGDFRPD